MIMDRNEISLRIIGKNGDAPFLQPTLTSGRYDSYSMRWRICCIQTGRNVKTALQFLMK